MADGPPNEVYIGMVDGQWPIRAFGGQVHALHWVQETQQKEGEHKVHLWLCRILSSQEMAVVPPSPPRLVPRYDGG